MTCSEGKLPKNFGGKQGGICVSMESIYVSYSFLRFCAAYLPME